ncbi:M3 family metallopeptidase [Sphingopyxis yananensis]|uniref:M3 family metallopeptidase n=1 Tax=Sphingopyxis yananensis TaxID=2886687 RepID=UPI001D111862|nr:M3 family metallopeptidase [Sphingopyxis yananensis]MCC2602988.1 M3 family metallopeptidase [Sphingopyxis yananensis]
MTENEVNSASAAPVAAEAPASDNPLLAKWTGPYEGVPPWDQMTPDQFPAAFQAAMDEYQNEVNAILRTRAVPTFENTFIPLMEAGETMDRVMSMWGVQSSNKSDDRVQAIDKEWSPKLTKFYTEMNLRPELFARYKTIYDNRHKAGLNAQQLRIVERAYEQLVRNGANLSDENKAKLVDINSDLEGLFSTFSANLLAEERGHIFVTDKAQLDGLPDGFVASLASAAAAQGKTGQWAIKNTRSSAQPVLQNANNRALREQTWRAFVSRGDNGNANDNKATIEQILKLRQDRASLLGFETHAHYRMADTMAKTPEKAMELMMRVWPAATARVREEVADMQAIADKEMKAAGKPSFTIAPWDYYYYAEKVRKAKYDLNEAEVKPYLQLDKLVDGMFWAAGQLYDMGFRENTGTIPVFDPKVRTFEVYDLKTNENIGVFYLDNFAREGKRSGAWMTTYRSQHKIGGDHNVLASNNNNFTEAANGQPTLISLDDASTLFHEFGHAIHYLSSDITYPMLGGVPRDFVEFPSQVNENWLLTPEVLSKFAVHVETGQPMPASLLKKINDSSKFNQGFSTVEYLSSAIIDMKLHHRTTPVTDVAAFEKQTLDALGMPKEIVMRHRMPQFSHLFSSDAYSAGYYSYLWSETMDADTWAAFEEAGSPWDRKVADAFKNILLKTGNETDRAEAYRVFRGRDPDVRALLKKRGFPAE